MWCDINLVPVELISTWRIWVVRHSFCSMCDSGGGLYPRAVTEYYIRRRVLQTDFIWDISTGSVELMQKMCLTQSPDLTYKCGPGLICATLWLLIYIHTFTIVNSPIKIYIYCSKWEQWWWTLYSFVLCCFLTNKQRYFYIFFKKSPHVA